MIPDLSALTFDLPLLPAVDPRSVQPHVLMWPLLFGIGLYLLLQAQPIGRPKPNLAERLLRLDVDELTSVVDHLRAVHDQGLPLVQSLAAQAEALRDRQRLRIVEEGGKASIRMVLPVALFILPVLFVVVLVPATQQLMNIGG
jgi:hypothetical protein